MYTEAQELAAKMCGTDWAGLLHSGLIRTIEKAETRCQRTGHELDGPALAVLITAWELVNPEERMVGE